MLSVATMFKKKFPNTKGVLILHDCEQNLKILDFERLPHSSMIFVGEKMGEGWERRNADGFREFKVLVNCHSTVIHGIHTKNIRVKK